MKRERQIGVRVGLPAFFALEVEDVYKHESGAHRALTFPDFLGLLVGLGLEAYRRGNAAQPEPEKENPDAATIGRGGKPPRREGTIVRFHAPAGIQAPDPAEQPMPEADPMPPFSEYRDAFRKLGIFAPRNHETIYRSLYRLRIRSLEELAETPPYKIHLRGIGPKTFGMIRNVLTSRGIGSEAWGIPEAVTQQEN